MGFYVQILAVALSNVMAYVAKERKGPRARPSTFSSPDSPDKSQPESMLELIVSAMMALHGRICKTNPLISSWMLLLIIYCSLKLTLALPTLNDRAQRRR
jgi:hypothetical protein